MSTMNPIKEQLDLNLFSKHDDDDDLFYKPKLQALVNGDVSPSQTATEIDTWIVETASNKLQSLKQRADPRNLTEEEEEQNMTLRQIGPNPSGAIEMVFGSVARLCTAFPPYHIGQTRIIQFMEALKALPEHTVPDGIPDGDLDQPDTITLWSFGHGWMNLREVFFHEADGSSSTQCLDLANRIEYSYDYSGVEAPGSEAQIRWRNFHSAIARITMLELVNCDDICVLHAILPSSSTYPDLEKRTIGGPNRIAGDLIAGVQWLVQPDEGRYVYRECTRGDLGSTSAWNMQFWEQVKEQLAFVAGDERFHREARDMATLASQRMALYENEQ